MNNNGNAFNKEICSLLLVHLGLYEAKLSKHQDKTNLFWKSLLQTAFTFVSMALCSLLTPQACILVCREAAEMKTIFFPCLL